MRLIGRKNKLSIVLISFTYDFKLRRNGEKGHFLAIIAYIPFFHRPNQICLSWPLGFDHQKLKVIYEQKLDSHT